MMIILVIIIITTILIEVSMDGFSRITYIFFYVTLVK